MKRFIVMIMVGLSIICVSYFFQRESTIVAAAEQVAPKANSSDIHYRRIFVPQTEIENLPIGKQKYIDINRNEFETLLKELQQQQKQKLFGRQTRIQKATYYARLKGNQLEDGQATLAITHQSKDSTLLNLGSMTLPVTTPKWIHSQGTNDAVLGVHSSGNINLLVSRSGRLNFHWSLSCQSSSGNEKQITIELPPSLNNQFIFDLPPGITPLVNHGITSKVKKIDPKIAVLAANHQRWKVELGTNTTAELRFTAVADTASITGSPSVSVTNIYQLNARQLILKTRIQYTARDNSRQEIKLLLQRGMQISKILSGKSELRWSVTRGDEHGNEVLVQLPLTSGSPQRSIIVEASAPLITQRLWKLPRIRPLGVFWKEEIISISSKAPLRIEQLLTSRCRQTSALLEEQVLLRCHSSDYSVKIYLGWEKPSIDVISGESILISQNESTALIQSIITRKANQIEQITADLSTPWRVESIESEPEGMIEDWDDTGFDNGRRTLSILLKEPFKEQSIRLKITARHRGITVGKTLSISEFRIIDFDHALTQRRLLSLQAAAEYRLKISGDEEVKRIIVEELSQQEASLLDYFAKGMLFELDASSENLRVELQRDQPNYRGEIDVHAVVKENNLYENYQLRCTPLSESLDRLRVTFYPSKKQQMQWQLVGDENQSFTAKRLTKQTIKKLKLSNLPSNAEMWEIVFDKPRSLDFELQAIRKSTISKTTELSLVEFSQASIQQGTLKVENLSPTKYSIRSELPQTIPQPTLLNEYPTSIAAFHYNPTRESITSAKTIKIVSSTLAPVKTSALIWEMNIQSRPSLSGRVDHLAILRIENSHASKIEFSLPESAQLNTVYVDHRKIDIQPGEEKNQSVTVDLPVKKRYPIVRIEYHTSDSPPGIFGSIRCVAPQVNLPILSQTCNVWIPPGYQVLGNHQKMINQPRARLNISERIFGPLGERNHEALAADDSQHSKQQKQALFLFLTALGEMNSDSNTATEDWITLLRRASEAVTKNITHNRPMILIDQSALSRIGVSSTSIPRFGDAEDDYSRGANRLQRYNLVLLISSDQWLLTSTEKLRQLPLQTQTVISDTVYRLPQSISSTTASSHSIFNEDSFSRITDFDIAAACSPMYWTSSVDQQFGSIDSRGWKSYILDMNGADEMILWSVRTVSITAMSWAGLLVALFFSWWKLSNRPWSVTISAFTISFIVLLLPDSYDILTPLFSFILLGFLAGYALSWLISIERIKVTLPNPEEQETASQLSTTHYVHLLLIAALITGISAAHADETDRGLATKKSARSSPIYRVIIPTNEKNEPVGETVYIPQELWQKIIQTLKVAKGTPRGWILEAGRYRGQIILQEKDQLKLKQFTVTYRITTFDQMSKVRISLARSAIDQQANTIRLDDKSLSQDQLTWHQKDQVFDLTIAEPGVHLLTVGLNTKTTMQAGSTQLKLNIPKIPNSTLEIKYPAEETKLQLKSRAEQVKLHQNPGRLIANLGLQDQITLRWATSQSSELRQQIEVDELMKLRINDGSVLLDAKFTYTIKNGQASGFLVSVDPQLKLLATDQDDLVASLKYKNSEHSQIEIKLKQPLKKDQRVTILLKFLLQDFNTAGQIEVPQLQSIDAKPKQRILAISIGKGIQFKIKNAENAKQYSSAEFSKSWGDEDQQKSQFVYEIPQGRLDWRLSIYPTQSKSKVDTTTILSFDRQIVQLNCLADVNTTGGSRLQYRLHIPRNILLQNVSVVSEKQEMVERWSQLASDDSLDRVITIFLSAPIEGKHQIALNGHFAVPAEGKISLPKITFEEMVVVNRLYRIARRRSVILRVQRIQGLQESSAIQTISLPKKYGRLEKDLRPEGEKYSAEVHFSQNHVDATSSFTMVLTQNDNRWQAELHGNLTVEHGVLDEIRLTLDPQWRGPFRLSNSSTESKILLRSQEPRELMIRPIKAITGKYHFTITAPVVSLSDELIHAPIPTINMPGQIQRYLVLPTQQINQQLFWQSRDLRITNLPDSIMTSFKLKKLNHVFYEVLSDRAEAILKSQQRVSRFPVIRLTEHIVRIEKDRHRTAISQFDFEPAGSLTCILQMPENVDLIHLAIDNFPATPKLLKPKDGKQRWLVRLLSPTLPQRIRVIYSDQLPEDDRWQPQLVLSAASIEGVEVLQTVWTILRPKQLLLDESGYQQHAISAHQSRMLQLKTTNSLIETIVKRSSGGMSASLQIWTRRRLSLKKQYDYEKSKAARSPSFTAGKKGLAIVGADTLPKNETPGQAMVYLLCHTDNHSQLDQFQQTVGPQLLRFQANLIWSQQNQLVYEVPIEFATTLQQLLQQLISDATKNFKITIRPMPYPNVDTEMSWLSTPLFYQQSYQVSHFAFQGNCDSITLPINTVADVRLLKRTLLIGLLIMISYTLYLLKQKTQLLQQLHNSPEAIGLLVAGFWIFFLSPVSIGWLIIALIVGFRLKKRFYRPVKRAEISYHGSSLIVAQSISNYPTEEQQDLK